MWQKLTAYSLLVSLARLEVTFISVNNIANPSSLINQNRAGYCERNDLLALLHTCPLLCFAIFFPEYQPHRSAGKAKGVSQLIF